ncbi:hypothetical protein ACH4SP_29090 [Streptomyces sp. NPDC021093]|uniref:hypothetical protein n=1 Tax=Streptomyces sp. NPDC021093 TaxID=3365112 RepID=UPI0037B32790
MVDEVLIALASAAGAAVASAAGTDAWSGFRQRVSRIFGRTGTPEARLALERLDRTAAELDRADAQDAERARATAVASWQAHFQHVLEGLSEADRAEVAVQLRELVATVRQPPGGATAGDGGLAVAGSADIRADHGSAAAGVMGDVTLGNPPGPVQGQS